METKNFYTNHSDKIITTSASSVWGINIYDFKIYVTLINFDA